MEKAHKIHLDREYCGSCYRRMFKRLPCGTCAGHAIVHKNHSDVVICFACEVAKRLCLRCERPVPRAALLVAGKAVCPSCAPYFRVSQCCAQCGKESLRIAAAPSIGIAEKICDSCRNKATHSTCVICRKYRKVARTGEHGVFCVDCAANEEVCHPCPDCGKTVPGTGLSRCRACLNRAKISQEVRLTSALFRSEWAATLWAGFANWVHERNPGSPRALASVKASQVFFERLDTHFRAVTDISADALLRAFSTSELRRHLLASRFVTSRLGLEISADAKQDSADADRIRSIVIEATRSAHEQLITGYLAYLDKRQLSTRTTRMYLSTAATFCATEEISDKAWAPGQLERYLQTNKGAKNNLTGFVTFCRQILRWDVSMPTGYAPVRSLADPMKSVKKLKDLLKKVQDHGLEKTNKQTVASIISTSLGFATSTISSLQKKDLQVTATRVSLTVAGETIDLPAELWPYAERFTHLLDESGS